MVEKEIKAQSFIHEIDFIKTKLDPLSPQERKGS